MLILLQLCVFVLWSFLLWSGLQVVLRKRPALAQWSTGYWLALFCCTLPLWPPLKWQQEWVIPAALLEPVAGTTAYWTAKVMHPGLSAQLHWSELLLMLLSCIWFSGACWRLWQLRQQWRRLSLLSAQADNLVLSAVLQGINPAAADQLGAQLAKLQIKQQQGTGSPFVFGFFRLSLLLPANFSDFPPAERVLLLQHELCHVQRCDPQQLVCWRLLAALCWFNPVVSKLEAAFVCAMEFCVDRQVLASQPELALSYGKAMLTSLKYQQHASQVSAGFTQQQLDEQFYQQRLVQLFQPVPLWPARRLTALVVVLLLLMLLGYLLLSQVWGQHAAPRQWQWPLQQVEVNSSFGVKSALRQYRPHSGLDLAGHTGDEVRAVATARVLIADDSTLHPNLGLVVLLDHGAGYQTLYAHLQQVNVKPGDRVLAGAPIAAVGSSGKATGAHLHFELLHQGVPQDPMLYLPALP